MPFAGWGATGAKWDYRGYKTVKFVRKTVRAAEKARAAVKTTDKAYDVGAVARTASASPSIPLPSFPNSVWERTLAKLRFASS